MKENLNIYRCSSCKDTGYVLDITDKHYTKERRYEKDGTTYLYESGTAVEYCFCEKGQDTRRESYERRRKRQ